MDIERANVMRPKMTSAMRASTSVKPRACFRPRCLAAIAACSRRRAGSGRPCSARRPRCLLRLFAQEGGKDALLRRISRPPLHRQGHFEQVLIVGRLDVLLPAIAGI